ncbi:MAG TPA: hypothetical protein VE078_19480 [Thermoanaerobaculia bacterium]|nr:hypothetical protein [Thermoanaerobaculia bacterium]
MARTGSRAKTRGLEILVFPVKSKTKPVYRAVVNGWGKVTQTKRYVAGRWDLAVFDAKTIKPEEINAPDSDFSLAWSSGAAVLLLDPSPEHKDALAARVIVISRDSSNAVFISRDTSSGTQSFDVRELVPPLKALSRRPKAPREKPKGVKRAGSTPAGRARKDPSPATVIDFGNGILERLARRAAPSVSAAAAPPAALKNFTVVDTMTKEYPSNERRGSTTITNTFRGFLNQGQGPGRTFQLLIIESAISGNPGVLDENNNKDRGLYTGYFRYKIYPGTENPMIWVNNIPATSGSPVQQSLKIDIEYKDPLGGYNSWPYEGSIHDSITGWRVNNETSGSTIAAVWAMIDPYDALRLDETCDQAGTGPKDYRIKPMPDMSVSTFLVHAIGAWRMEKINAGPVYFLSRSSISFQGVCYYKSNTRVSWYDIEPLGSHSMWVIDFSPITP